MGHERIKLKRIANKMRQRTKGSLVFVIVE